MNAEIHRADLQLRRRIVIVLGMGALAAIIVLVWFGHWLDRSAAATQNDLLVLKMHRMIGITGMGCGLCVLVLAGYVARLARRVIEERRWPLRASRVVLDTQVRDGANALRFARMLNVVAIMLIVLALGSGLLGWRLLGTM